PPRRHVAAVGAADRPPNPKPVRASHRLTLPSVLQARRDPVNRSQDGLEMGGTTWIVGRKPTQLTQQPHLEVAHWVEVGVAEAQAGQQLRLSLQDCTLHGNLEDGIVRALELRLA